MSDNTQKQRRKKLTAKKIINRLEKVVDWLTGKRCFLLITIPIISLLLILSHFFRIAGFLLSVLLLILYMFIVKKRKSASLADCILVLFLVVLIIVGQDNFIKGLKGWNQFVQRMIEKSDIEAGIKDGNPYVKKITSVPQAKTSDIPKEEEASPQNITVAVSKKPDKNLINNGDFTDNFSKWGYGFYSDRRKAQYPDSDFVWLNFLNADISVMIVETEIGNALKIVHSSETAPHRVGIMEQYINVSTPGKYTLSFKAKALDDFEEGAIWFSIRNNWVGPVTIQKKGPFEWEDFSGDFNIDKTGQITFTIISQGKGTVYLTDISLVKVPE